MSIIAHRPPEIYHVALVAHRAGLCIVPPREDGSKAPLGEWQQYQRQRPSLQQLQRWYGPRTGIGLVCGCISGNLECLEFDDAQGYADYLELATATGLKDLVERVEAGYLERSPSGGIHWLYRCSAISGNTKLARRPKTTAQIKDLNDKVKTLIETRGEGGYVIVAPSYGKVHPTGKPYKLLRGGLATIPTISPEERKAIFELGRSFDEMPKQTVGEGPRQPASATGTRPGDLFNARAFWSDILAPHGWTHVYQRGEVEYWRRPGKDRGISATVNYAGSNLLYVFSTSTLFEAERGYSMFSAYTVLEHAGDFKAAARAVAEQSQNGQLQAGPKHRRGRHQHVINRIEVEL